MKNYEYVDRELNVSKKKMNNKCCSNTSCDEKTCTKQAINKSVIDDITDENKSSIWDNESFWDAYYKSLGPYNNQLDLPFVDEDKVEYDIDWKYNELEILDDIERYIAETYSEHYSKNSDIQLAEYIIARGRGEDFFIGNILKYADRYGKKSGYNIKDLYKVIHYAILAIYNQQMVHKDANWY